MSTGKVIRVIVLALLTCFALPSRADELAEKGRNIFTQNQRVVVTVEVVMKTKMSVAGAVNQSSESKQDATGTVVDPSGLTVMALSTLDPGDMLQNIMSGAGGDNEDLKFKMDTELSDIKILTDDGTELSSEVVLRDKDLDLAFIRPKTKPTAPMASLDLANSAPAQLLDQVIGLNRLGKAAGRAYSVSVERISAVVQKPRLFYIPDSAATMTSMGCPAFSLDGRIVGIFVTHSVSSKGSGGMSMFSFRPEGITGVILPAADVLKVAKQAPQQKEDQDAKDKGEKK